ncbi:MAG: OmpA family protein [Bacteroidales bacterium]|nr:OmpA family protein [Bacteroidales bacterium]
MKNLLAILTFFYFLFYVSTLSAQQPQLTTDNKKALKRFEAAEVAYRQKAFSEAIISLKKALKSDNEFTEAWLLLGDAYAELSRKEEAVRAYEKAVAVDSAFFPGLYYFLGQLQYELGDYGQAVQSFRKLLNFPDITPGRRQRGQAGLEKACFALHAVQHPAGIQPENMGDSVNTTADEYINFVNETADRLVLTRKMNRKTEGAAARLFTETFFHAELINGEWALPSPLVLPWQQGLDVGGMSLSVDGRKMYFTGCYWPGGYGSCDLYVSSRQGQQWLEPSGLGAAINSPWWDSQPVISSDGKQLFFSSKRKGGKGGSDIWMSIKLPNGKWSPPLNLGDSINTSGDEMAPFLHADGQTLFFSSTGRPGLGGADLFVSRKNMAGQWSQAQNPGYPLNTKDNEINIFVSLDGDQAWISSDRDGGNGGFDIFNFQTNDEIRPEKVLFVKGVVMDLESGKLLGAKVVLTNLLNNRVEDSTNADPVSGEFLMVLHPGMDYAFNITKKNYLFYSKNLNLSTDGAGEHLQQTFRLTPLRKGAQITLENVFFDFNSARLKPASFAELNKLLEMLTQNKDLRLLIAGHTDSIGDATYNQKLSADRAFVVYNFLVSRGIEADRLEYKGFGATRPVASNTSEEGRKKNRRTEVRVL